jgi:hypothetical protein
VLIESASDFISNNDDVNLEYGNSLEVLLYVNGVELNFDFMAKDRLRGVVESFISIAPALYNPEEMKSLILIGWEDVQFLDRLRNGWIIYNPKEIELWRDEFMVELLPTYIAVREYFEGIEFLEDAISAKKGINKSATYIGRMVVERGLFALLGSLGYTNQSKKWLFYWIEEVKDDSTRELLNSGVELLFPENPNKDSLTEIEYVDKVAVFYRLVRRELDQNVAIAKAIKFLNSKINYIDLDIENDH